MPIQGNSPGPGESVTQSSSATTIPNSEPVKFSIRKFDDSFAASREQDLEDGPLLLDIGSILTTEEANYQLDSDPIISTSDLNHSTRLERLPFLSELPLNHELLAGAYAEKSTQSKSSSGPSLSVPTDSASYVEPHLDEHSLTERRLSGMQRILEENSRSHSASSSKEQTKTRPSLFPEPLFPWRIEFSWDRDRLVLAGDDFKVNRQPSSDDSLSLCVNVPSCVNEPSCANVPSSDKTSARSSVESSEPMVRKVDLSDDEISSMLFDFYADLKSTLSDGYWRTHGPQRSTGTSSKARQEGRDNRSSNPYGGNVSRGSSQLGPQHSQRRRVNRSDNGNDDEDDPENGDWKHIPPPDLHSIPLRVDCPYFKRNPNLFRRCCGKGFTQIKYLKQHLKDRHQEPHCDVCLRIVQPSHRDQHKCTIKLKPSEVSYMTEQNCAFIDKRIKRNGSLPDKWREIYENLFPDDKSNPSPYVQQEVQVYAGQVETYASQAKANIREKISEFWQHLEQSLSSKTFAALQSEREAVEKVTEMWVSETIYSHCLDERRLQTRGPASSDITEQTPTRTDTPRPYDRQLTEARTSSSSQNGADLSSCVNNSLSLDTMSWTPPADQTTKLSDGETTPTIYSFDIGTLGNTQGVDTSSMTCPTAEPFFHQQPSFNTYSTPWFPGTLFDAENHASSSLVGPDADYTQPGFLTLSDPFLNFNEFCPVSPTTRREQSVHSG
ncbi:hypothetical protein F4821DRAFT_25106 [Hypoxylon rubiginosum]|uniref:Uncharacterized protein n=1 Tax=Hypoxylon rubiginosum TaxID=110542 RepID=A0ACC0CMI5_9PEZI|nr:hypothetical protein F4821DRAFT_25106 [Hypoxylon rubiginosum]